MGDSQDDIVRVEFDRTIKVEFHGSTVTNDAGLLAYRELDDALRLTSTAASGLHDTRTGQNTQHSLLALLRQSISSRLAGYEDVNDAERLGVRVAVALNGSTSRRRASVVRRAGRFQGLSKGEASAAVGSGRDGAGCGDAFGVKIVAIVPPRGYPQPPESQPRPEGAPIWERSGKGLGIRDWGLGKTGCLPSNP